VIKNYFKIALRNIIRQKTFSLINILGLSLGLTLFILILLFVQHEFSFDKFNKNYENIYRVELDYGGQGQFIALTNNALGPALLKDYPEVINQTRFRNMGNSIMLDAGNDRKYYEDSGWWAENSFFEVFTYNFTAGNPATALSEPYSIVLTETLAEKYFPGQNPLSRVIKINNDFSCTVTGVVEDSPGNSHIIYGYFISYNTYDKVITPNYLDNWTIIGGYNYVVLNDNVSLDGINEKIRGILRTYINAEYPSHVYLKPLSEMHLYSNVLGELGPSGSVDTIIIYLAIGIFILLIASINFMNLSTARSMKRAKEVGMRKVSGANKSDLIIQFIGESILLSFISLLIAIILLNISITEFNAIIGRKISLDFGSNSLLTFGLFGIALFVGIISGSYPALYLARFNPVKVLRSSFKTKPKKFSERNILVVFQFTISVILIIGTIIIYSQLNFLRGKDVGYDKENIVVMNFKYSDSLTVGRYETFKEEIAKLPSIEKVSISQFVPFFNGSSFQTSFEGAPEGEGIYTNINYSDERFLKTFGIKLLLGKEELNAEMNEDSTYECYINEAFRKKVNWDMPLGKRIGYLRVAGVINDYQFTSLKNATQPIILCRLNGWVPRFINREMSLSIKYNPVGEAATIEKIKTLFLQYFPYEIFDVRSMESLFDNMLRREDTVGKTAGYFSILAIFISCLGLFGLSSFVAEQKRKEIGVRKVLGSSIFGIVVLLTRNFSILILIANIIAAPLAYYFLNNWLHEFAYRIEVEWYVFLLAVILTLLIGWVSVAFQTVKAAISNPVDSLRYE